MLTHAQPGRQPRRRPRRARSHDEDDVALSFLPLCHAFERMVAYVYLASGVSMIFAESIDTVARDLLIVRPTVMTGVPRVFEKLHARIAREGPRERRASSAAIFDWARVGGRAREAGGCRTAAAVRLACACTSRARRPARLRARSATASAAGCASPSPAARRSRVDSAEFFYGVGLPILEGYGLTETSPVLCVMPLEKRSVRHGRAAAAERRAAHRRRRRDSRARSERHDAATSSGRDETARPSSATAGSTPATSARSTSAGYLRITDRKKELHRHVGRQEDRAAADRSSAAGRSAGRRGRARRRRAALSGGAARAGLRRAAGRALGVDGRRTRATRRSSAPAEVRALFQAAVDAVNARLAQFERIKKFVAAARGVHAWTPASSRRR